MKVLNRLPVSRVARYTVPVLLLIYAASGFYQVRPDELGVVLRFGAVARSSVPPGLHYHLPWPIEEQYTPKTTEVRKISVGFNVFDNLLDEEPESLEAQRLTGDTNIIAIKSMVHYVVDDPVQFLFGAENPALLVQAAAELVLTETVAGKEVDWVLTTGRTELQVQVKAQTQALLDQLHAGIRLTAVNFVTIEPPLDVIEAFNDVSSAKIEREELINKAESVANFVLPKARGEAHELLEQAKAYQTECLAQAKGLTQTFVSLKNYYVTAPAITRQRMYLEAISECLAHQQVIVPSNGDNLRLTLLEEGQTLKPQVDKQ